MSVHVASWSLRTESFVMLTRDGNAVILKPGLRAKNLHLLFSPHGAAPYLRACECYHSPG